MATRAALEAAPPPDADADAARERGDGAPTNEPRYQRVLAELVARIGSGAYEVGSLIPTEADLCAEFSVSRFTVREALRRLTETGLVSRQQGRGTRVLAAEPAAGYVQTMRSLEGLFQYARDTRLHITKVTRTVPRPALASVLGRSTGREWVRLDAVRRTEAGEPVCTTRIYLHSDFADAADAIRASADAVYRVIEERFGVRVEEVRQDLAAEPLTAAQARTLGREPGTPGIRVTRRYIDEDDGPLMVTINHYAADRFSYSMTLRREEIR